MFILLLVLLGLNVSPASLCSLHTTFHSSSSSTLKSLHTTSSFSVVYWCLSSSYEMQCHTELIVTGSGMSAKKKSTSSQPVSIQSYDIGTIQIMSYLVTPKIQPCLCYVVDLTEVCRCFMYRACGLGSKRWSMFWIW